MNEIVKEMIIQYVPVLVELIVTVISGIAVSYIKKKIKNEEIRSVIATVVRATEQIHKDIHGHEKLSSAEKRVKRILESKGIKIPDYEITTLIESAVHDMNTEVIGACKSGDE